MPERPFSILHRHFRDISLTLYPRISYSRDIKTRLIDSQADATGAAGGPQGTEGAVKVNQPANQAGGGCC